MKKSLKITLVVAFAGLLVLSAINSSKIKDAAEQAGFDNVEEYKTAQIKNIETKAEYDAFVQRQAEIEAKAATNGGFLSVDEYKKAKAVDMPTKELYDQYLVQQAESKLAEDQRRVEESKKITAEKNSEEEETVKVDTVKINPDSSTSERINESISIVKSGLDYPSMGTPYTEMQSRCARKPSSLNNEKEHYSCRGISDDRFLVSKGIFVFGPDKSLKARFFSFINESESDQFINDKDILEILDKRFGSRALTQTGKIRFSYQNQDTRFTAVSYGCPAYFTDKPGMEVPGGTPKSHQIIWVETGVVPNLDDAERYDFEVIKNEVVNSSSCVVALVNYGGTNIPRGIDEKQYYKAEVHVLEVDPKFVLMNTKHW